MKGELYLKLYMVQAKKLLKFKELHHFFLNKFDLIESQVYRDIYDKSIVCRQSHSARVAIIKSIANRNLNVDAMITNQNLNIAIQTADCLPILFYEAKKKIIAVAHAGWKGLEKGIIRKTLLKIYQMGGEACNLVSGIGPHIGICCYNVGYPRILKFVKKGFDSKIIAKNIQGSWHLDLGMIAQISMIKNGMEPINIESIDDCTSCNKEYFSYRRDKYSNGRMFSIIGLTS